MPAADGATREPARMLPDARSGALDSGMAIPPAGPVADAAPDNLVDRYAPDWLKPFARLARLDRPIGWQLLLLPCWWSLWLGADAVGRAFPPVLDLLLFLVGAIVMRGAGCTYNDIADRHLDARVARTRSRPIPSGQVSVREAVLFMLFLALIGLMVLIWFNTFTVVLGLSSLMVVAIYPFMKRFSDWPQLILGFAFSWGALMGWAAIWGKLHVATLFLYAGCVLWVVGYDTIYAMQDVEDDALIGVRSTARRFGGAARRLVAACYLGTVALFGAAFWYGGAEWIAFAGLALGAGHLGWQVWRLDPKSPAVALAVFRSNRVFGLILLAAIAADAIATPLRRPPEAPVNGLNGPALAVLPAPGAAGIVPAVSARRV